MTTRRLFGYNAYNTEDPRQLLMLKRQESQALLEIVRADRHDTSPEDWINLVVHTIRMQLSVRRLLFVTHFTASYDVRANYGFEQVPKGLFDELSTLLETTRVDPKRQPNLAEQGAEYVIPLGPFQAPTGWVCIAEFAESEQEEVNDLTFIETAGNIMVTSLHNKRMVKETVNRELLQRELDLAASIQRQALPRDFNLAPSIDIHATTRTPLEIGGDFYDLIPISANEFYFLIGDAAGKGMPGALLISNIQASIRALLTFSSSLAQTITLLERTITRLTSPGQFATLFMGRLNLATSEIQYINAGHNPPLMLRANGRLEELNTGCIPLGLMPIDAPEEGTTTFQPGDVLVLYTDGLVEQPNAVGGLMGLEPVRERLRMVGTLPAGLILENLLAQCQDYAQGVPNPDDLSLMVLKRTEDAKPGRSAQ